MACVLKRCDCSCQPQPLSHLPHMKVTPRLQHKLAHNSETENAYAAVCWIHLASTHSPLFPYFVSFLLVLFFPRSLGAISTSSLPICFSIYCILSAFALHTPPELTNNLQLPSSMDSLGSRANVMSVVSCSRTGPWTQKGPTFGLMFHHCCLEILSNF